MVAKKFTDEENCTANALPLCIADTVDVVRRRDDECMALSASSLPRHGNDDSDTLE